MGKSKKRRSGGGGGGGETAAAETAPTKPKATMGNQATATNSVTSHKQNGESSMQDWISSLAKQSAAATADETACIRSKEERKERRAAKKRQRQERQEVKQQQQQQTAASVSRKGEPQHQADGRPTPPTRHGVEITLQRLERLADRIVHCCKSTRNTSLVAKSCRKNEGNNNDDDDDDDVEPSRKKARRRQEMRLHNLQKKSQPFDKSENKVVCLRKRNWDTPAHIQPRTANANVSSNNHRRAGYSGMGCARPSLLLSFSDASFLEQLEQEFAEHVPGFSKRRYSKADKKRRDGNMLWRQLQQEKQHASDGGKNKKQNSFLSKLSPNERVEAMLQAGIL